MVNGEIVNISDNAIHIMLDILFHLLIVKVFLDSNTVVSGKALIVLYLTLVIHTLLLSVVYLNNFVVVFMVHHYGI